MLTCLNLLPLISMRGERHDYTGRRLNRVG